MVTFDRSGQQPFFLSFCISLFLENNEQYRTYEKQELIEQERDYTCLLYTSLLRLFFSVESLDDVVTCIHFLDVPVYITEILLLVLEVALRF